MPAAPRRVTRRPSKTAEKPHQKPKFNFRQTLVQFLTNKAVAEAATLRNEGDKKAGVVGLKETLREWVMSHGEQDEKGSFFLDLDEPVDIDVNGQRYTQVKVERRQGDPYLNTDKAWAFLDEKGLRDEVEEFRYVLRLEPETAEVFGDWLKESGLIERVESTDSVLVEDKLLALHHRKVKKGNKTVRVITEEELDGLYDTPDPTWAFKPLTS